MFGAALIWSCTFIGNRGSAVLGRYSIRAYSILTLAIELTPAIAKHICPLAYQVEKVFHGDIVMVLSDKNAALVGGYPRLPPAVIGCVIRDLGLRTTAQRGTLYPRGRP